MVSILRKNLTSLFPNHASYHRLSPLISSLRYFSTSKDGECAASPALFDLLRNKHQFSIQAASKVTSYLNRVKSRVKDPENTDSILSYLKECGFSIAQLEKFAKYRPDVLKVDLESTVKPKIRVLTDLGFSSDDVAKMLSTNPSILLLNLETRVIPSFSILKGLLGSNDAVAKLWKASPWFLVGNLEKTLVPNVEFLKSCGIPMERVFVLLNKDPNCLLLNPKVVRNSAELAEKMGAQRCSNMFIYCIRAIASFSPKTWELKLQALRDRGFSECDINTLFRKAPQMFCLSAERLIRATDFIIINGKYNMACILTYPTALGCSIEKRLKPRFRVVEILVSKKLIKCRPVLGAVTLLSEQRFFDKFVAPYIDEVGKVYAAKSLAIAE
ncbi:uncharacterized protein LOC127257482 [Andrographis paniculata]|uniref:uncharacterized protein LOC127257482 n=1 Tax=Andrographis paniculata TaxID=175694 RepID=UPI0021E889EE|nr:uncharacterized protein LOC127257482 [Andrographis paniculata]XP_051139886.1 uncharacterized protein LOC127257482 [Andrographis paniculata]